MKKTIIYDPKNGSETVTGKALANALVLLDRSFVVADSSEEVMQVTDNETIDSILVVVDDRDGIRAGNQIKRRHFDTPVVFATNPELDDELASRLNGDYFPMSSLSQLAISLDNQSTIEKVLEKDYGFAFEADPEGLTRVLMDQFSEPLLCFRELVQNSTDAEASRIDISTHYDTEKELLSVSVSDDGCGMNLDQIMIYLTLFDSTKDTNIKKIGQMGAGKVFAHALGPELSVVHTGDGNEGHKVIFNPDLSGKIVKTEPYQGTDVQLLLPMKRYKAREFNKKLNTVVRKWCQYIETPLFINDQKVNLPFELTGKYALNLREEGLNAVIAPSIDRRGFGLYKGGILLEDDAYIYSSSHEKGNIMNHFSGMIDADIFDFPISRNGVVQNDDYEHLMNRLKDVIIKEYTPLFLQDFQKRNTSRIHKNKMTDFFQLIIANNGYYCLEETVLDSITELPLFENVDGKMLSVKEIKDKLNTSNCLYYTNNGLSSQELNSFLEKDIPVLKNPDWLVLRDIFGRYNQQCLDERVYRGHSSRTYGVFNFDSIGSLLRKGFVQKISSSSFGGGSGFGGSGFGGSGLRSNGDGTFDNPFDFSSLRIYGAEFKDLDGQPNENVLLDSYVEGSGYSRSHNVVLNVHHPFMKKMETLYHRNETYAQYLIACELIQSEKVFGNVSHKLREHEMSRIGLKVLDND